ncbi:MAG: TonB-dependent receptor [Prolixibacteraceae bacterium]|nr:TonB-dependent receptor [Prolixibacteraceae bacterium]
MNKIIVMLAGLILSVTAISFAQKPKTDANIVGHVTNNGAHLPYANISLKGTTIGTLTDESGHFQLVNCPPGTYFLVANSLGYKTQEKHVIVEFGKTVEVKFSLEEDAFNISEVIVSSNRSEQKRTDAPMIVNTISLKLFNTTQSATLGDGLNFCPGLRLENNCQNCGFTQVRMNGMEGPYSQILINSRPIFSGLAGVYGLELIPSNMIERVEVVRGGGSALFGGNAIAGTINIILKDPINNSYEIGANTGLTGVGLNNSGGSAADYSVNFNTSIVSDDRKTGVAVYGFSRERKMFDANNDGFSEISPMKNLTIGTRFFHRFGHRSRATVDFFNIKEERDGGNKHDYPLHERDVAEAVEHDIKTVAFTYDQFFREYDMLSVFASGQFLNRDSYYGANYSLSDYGNSKDKTYNMGVQYKAMFGNSSLIGGIENTGGFLTDKKMGYPDYENAVIVDGKIETIPHTENTLVADQSTVTTGMFAQYELKFNKTKLTAGGRFDMYKIEDYAKSSNKKTGNVFSPRISLMQELTRSLQARASYSQGYRAPQIFDEDLHIETSGSRQVINVNDPNLKQETSHSVMGSLDFNQLIGNVYTSFLLEGFYTRLDHPFVNEIGTPDENGTVLYTRRNAEDGAAVQGINIELKLKPFVDFSLTSGFTIQTSRYDNPQEFNERRFFRTPDNYGFFALDWDFLKNFCLSATGNYTGRMLVPYFGPLADPELGQLHRTNSFFDWGTKLSYTVKLNGAKLQFLGGIKNVFNAYQSDFDSGADRDPAYMYGPTQPRTIYFGIKIGNML